VWLPWQIAFGCAAVCAIASACVPVTWRETRAILRELAIFLTLYALWRLVGLISVTGVEGAFARGLDLWHLERWMHLPSELTLQRWTLHATWLVQFADAYYIVAHVLPVGVFLVWLFFRHRDRYPGWRNILFGVSVVCVLIQMIAVAPPRFYPRLGFVDTAAVYGPSVYDSAGQGLAGQLAAMPSLHVGWAVLIAVAVVRISPSKWRWLVLAHPVLTVFAVTVTAYHWLLDGILAAALVAAGMAVGVWFRSRVSEPFPRRAAVLVAARSGVDEGDELVP
jgi:hypothetical protein